MPVYMIGGTAAALTCDRSGPAAMSVSDGPAGTMEKEPPK